MDILTETKNSKNWLLPTLSHPIVPQVDHSPNLSIFQCQLLSNFKTWKSQKAKLLKICCFYILFYKSVGAEWDWMRFGHRNKKRMVKLYNIVIKWELIMLWINFKEDNFMKKTTCIYELAQFGAKYYEHTY